MRPTIPLSLGRLSGKTALITGAGSGIGEGIAKFFTKEGANVVIADIAKDGGERVEKDIQQSHFEGHGRALFLNFDCTTSRAWKDGLKFARDEFGNLDIVVNNAGTTYNKKSSVEVTEAEFDKIIAVNTKSIYHSVVEIMPYMAEQRRGVFINTSSVAGFKVRPGQVFYGGTKGFVNTVS